MVVVGLRAVQCKHLSGGLEVALVVVERIGVNGIDESLLERTIGPGLGGKRAHDCNRTRLVPSSLSR